MQGGQVRWGSGLGWGGVGEGQVGGGGERGGQLGSKPWAHPPPGHSHRFRGSTSHQCWHGTLALATSVRYQHTSTGASVRRPAVSFSHQPPPSHLYTSQSLRQMTSSIAPQRQSKKGPSPNPGVCSHTCTRHRPRHPGQATRRSGQPRPDRKGMALTPWLACQPSQGLPAAPAGLTC